MREVISKVKLQVSWDQKKFKDKVARDLIR